MRNVEEVELVTSSSGLTGARFDRCSVDLTTGALLRSGIRVPLQGQPFQVLRLLLEAEGKVVTRDDLRTALWPEDTFVDFELGVNTAVKKLRQALDDSAEHPRFIETLPKLGYRFMLPVEWVNGIGPMPAIALIQSPEPTAVVPRPPHVNRPWKLIVAVAVAAVAVVASLISLSDEHSYLSRTRLGMLTHRAVFGHSFTQPILTERRLTANPEDAPINSAVISPDGKYLAYTDKTGFYLKQVESGETHPVPLPKGFEPLAESWFPDSIHMLVSWGADAQELPSLWEISVLGGSPRKLADGGAYPRVSPDGSTIAYLSGNGGFGVNEIWLIEADGGRARRILGGTGGEARVGFSAVAWAPDGRRVACVRTTYRPYNAEETRIEIADTSGGKIEAAVSMPGLGQTLAWTNDNHLLYALHEPAPNQKDFNLWRVQLDSRTAHPDGPAIRITNGRGRAAELSVTGDGKLLALRRKQYQGAVYLADLTEGGKRFSTPKRLTMDERGPLPFSWTPDSRAVIFTSYREGPRNIYKQAIDSTQPELLVGGNETLNISRLNPDSTELLYLAIPNPGQPSQSVRIMRVPLAGGPSQFVLEAPWISNQQCARLPSTLCIYSSPGEPRQARFFRFDPVTGASAEIVAARCDSCGGGSLSPDGKYLASARVGLKNASEVRVVSLADSSERTIMVPRWPIIAGVDWAADSKSVWISVFSRYATGFREDTDQAVLNVDLNGKITNTLENDSVWFGWVIPSPDGRRVAINGTTVNSNVWLLQNF